VNLAILLGVHMKLENLSKLGVLTAVVLGVIAGAARLHHPQSQHSERVILVSQSGQQIPSLFDGLPRVPAYSLKQIDLENKNGRPSGPCKPGGPAKQSALGRLFGTPVYASNCFPGLCGGTQWTLIRDNCDTGGLCSGLYNRAVWDPMGDPCQGFAPNSGHCGTDCACGQSDQICILC
jgi:hypothetical protein